MVRYDGGWLSDSTVLDVRDPKRCPPYPCVLVNAQGEKIPGAFYYDFATGKLGRYAVRVRPDGQELATVEYELTETGVKKTPVEVWEHVPGLRLVPVSAGRRLGGTLVFKNGQ